MSRVSIAMAALGILLMSLVAIRFIECLAALRIRGRVHGGLSLGVTPRKLAGSSNWHTESGYSPAMEKCLGAYGPVDSPSPPHMIGLEPISGGAAVEDMRLMSGEDGAARGPMSADERALYLILGLLVQVAKGELKPGGDEQTRHTSAEDDAAEGPMSGGDDATTRLMSAEDDAAEGPMSGGDDATKRLMSAEDDAAAGPMSGGDEETRVLIPAEAGSQGEEGVPQNSPAQAVRETPSHPTRAYQLARKKQWVHRLGYIVAGTMAISLFVAGTVILSGRMDEGGKTDSTVELLGAGLVVAGVVMAVTTLVVYSLMAPRRNRDRVVEA